MKGKIIVVDQDNAFASEVAKVLEMDQNNVFSLNSGEQVLEILRKVGIHVVICGNLPPEMDRLELLKTIKNENPSTEVVLMIETPTVELLEGAMKGGAYDCVRLPIQEWDSFKKIVSEAFQKSQLVLKNKQLIEDLLRKNQELMESHNTISVIHQDTEALYYFGRCLATSLNLEEIYAMMTNATNKLLNNRPIFLLLLNEKESCLYLKKAIGFNGPMDDFTVPIESHYKNNLMDWLDKEKYIETFNRKFSNSLENNSFLSKPIVIHNKFYGILVVLQNRESECTEREVNLFKQFVSQSAFVLENALLHEKTNELANRDELTGVFNRRYFQEKIEEEIKRALRQTGHFSLIILDIDYFKYYNDTYGHIQGDLLLKELVSLMAERLRSTDIVSRFGGDEFVILLIDTEKYAALEIGNQIRENVENNPNFKLDYGYEKKITISMGISQFPDDGLTSIDLIRKADQALYVAKARGRNQVAS
ncbi:MAG: sensor domain-containing diguanylate cyclase [Nitrospiria bacterium]